MNNWTFIPKILKSITLVSGEGNLREGEACVMSAANYYYRRKHDKTFDETSDDCECVSPLLRELVITRNDSAWGSDKERTDWGLPLAYKVLDTNGDSNLLKEQLKVILKGFVNYYFLPYLKLMDKAAKTPELWQFKYENFYSKEEAAKISIFTTKARKLAKQMLPISEKSCDAASEALALLKDFNLSIDFGYRSSACILTSGHKLTGEIEALQESMVAGLTAFVFFCNEIFTKSSIKKDYEVAELFGGFDYSCSSMLGCKALEKVIVDVIKHSIKTKNKTRRQLKQVKKEFEAELKKHPEKMLHDVAIVATSNCIGLGCP